MEATKWIQFNCFYEHSFKFSLNQKLESRNKLHPYFRIFLSHFSLTLSCTHSLSYTRTQTIGLSLIYFVFKYSHQHTHTYIELYPTVPLLNIFFYFPRFLIDPKQFDTPYYVLNFRNLILLLLLSIYKSSVCTSILIMLHL